MQDPPMLTAEQFARLLDKNEALITALQQRANHKEDALRNVRGIMDNASVGIALTRDRKYIRYNNSFAQMFGFVESSGIGQPGQTIYVSDESYAEVGRLAGPLLSEGLPFEHELYMRRQDGSQFWVNLKGFLANPGDPKAGTFWITEDRSAFRAAEDQIVKSRLVTETALREIKGIMDNAPFGIIFTLDRKIFRYNESFRRMFGIPGDTAIGQPARIFFPSDEAYEYVGRVAGPILSQAQPFEQELFLCRQDGSEFWGNLKGFVADPDDASAGTIWIVQDRSIFKAAEAEIEKSHQELAAIFESSIHGIAFIKDRTMIKANSKLEELFGYAPGELRGRPTRCWYPDDESYQAIGSAYRFLAQGLTHRSVMQMRRKDGSLFWARLSGCGLSADPALGSVWTVENITVEHEATEAIVRAKDRAEAAEVKLRDSNAELEQANQRLLTLDQLKSEFLSTVSHELRTPLTSIRGFASLVEREFSRSFASLAGADAGLIKKSERIRDNLSIILKEAERLTRLINDVLDLAKIESGRTEWRDKLLRVADLVRDAAEAASGMFAQKPSVSLELEIGVKLPHFIGDADHMQQVLINLLNNAVKFTDRGSVTLTAFLNSERKIQIDIRDTGIGFPPEDAEAIFSKFQQAKQGDTLMDRPKGTGLGLAISQQIVNRHGGNIWAKSEPGKGSVFSLTLPPAPAS